MRKRIRTALTAVMMVAPLAAPAVGQDGAGFLALPRLTVEAVGPAAAAPGQRFDVTFTVTIATGYHLYAPTKQAHDQRILKIKVAPPTWAAGQPAYSPPKPFDLRIAGEEESLVYEGQFTVRVPVLVPADTPPGPHSVTISLTGQTCDDKGCYPENLSGTATVDVRGTPFRTAKQWDADPPDGEPTTPATQPAASADADGPAEPGEADDGRPGAGLTFLTAFALALLAGVALNVMPCVLPVIPLKIMSILEQAKQSRRRSITLGAAYAAGILAFFLTVGAASVALRLTTGLVLDLNEPFGYPSVVIGLALLLVVVALGLFNAYTINIGGRWGGGRIGGGHAGSLAMGFLTAVLATPCSGPVLAAVFGWAQTQPAWVGGVTFALLGLGMAAPHALLTSFPSLLAKLPKPGLWMERLRQGSALVLLLVVVWLLSTLGSAKWTAWVAAYAVLLGGCVWIGWGWINFNTPARKRRIVRAVMLALAVAGAFWMLPEPPTSPMNWQPFDRPALEADAEAGEVVLVHFTADWCAICKQLEWKTYDQPDTAAGVRHRNAVAIKADVTRTDSPAADMLKNHFREPGLPVTIIYGPALKTPRRLRGVFSQQKLFDALDKAAGKE